MARKILIIVLGLFLIFTTFLLIFLPTIIKKYIETNDERFIGRQVSLGKVGFNTFTGRLTITDFKLFEKDGKTLFAGFEEFNIKTNLWNLIRSEYIIDKLKLTRPFLNILISEGLFNFDDLINSGSESTQVSDSEKSGFKEIRWRVNNIQITNGSLSYSDQMFGTSLLAENIEISCPQLAWDSDTLKSDIGFNLQSGGEFLVNLMLQLKDSKLITHLELNNINLQPLTSPLTEYLNISELKGELTSDLDLWVNLKEPTDISLKGKFDLDNFLLINNESEDIFGLKNLSIGIDTINIKNNIYRLQSININDPFVLVEMYDDGDNWSMLMPDTEPDTTLQDVSSELEIFETYNVFALMANYIREIAKSYTATDYRFDSLNINRGILQYNDYTLDETFSYTVTDMKIRSKQINSNADSIQFDMSVLLNGESRGIAKIMIDPQNYSNMQVFYDFYETNLASLTPYSVYYISYPIDKAILNYSSRTTIQEGVLKSVNKINITGFKFGPKTQNMKAYDLPVKLAIAILKDANGNINLEIPVAGDLNDPKFKLGKVILNILKNLVVKLATAPFRLLADAIGSDETDLKEISFNFLETEIGKHQLKSLEPLSRILYQKDDLNLELIQLVDTTKEIEYFATAEAKKRYYAEEILKTKPDSIAFTEEMYTEINSIHIKDSLFIVWLDFKLPPENIDIPTQKKCRLLIGESESKEAVRNIIFKRQENIRRYFCEVKGLNPDRISFLRLDKIDVTEREKLDTNADRPKFIVQIAIN